MAFCCCGAGATSSVTAKNTSQLRHLETMGIARGPSPRLRRTEVQIPVTLNVYSLLESNKKLSKMGMGVFHTGVVVYGIEWGYGEVVENPNASGLFCVHPGQAAGTLYRTIRIGYTTRSPMQVDTILHRLENEWRSCEYHILHHNCNHFAQAFCDLLTTTEKLQVPSWCNRAARVGDRIIPRKLATKVQHMMDDEPPKAVAPTPFSNINEVPMSVVPREWYLHPSIFQPMRYVGESRSESLRSRDNVPAAAATNASHNGNGGGGSSHYTVEYDILPPPGYEPADPSSPYPPLMHRETFLATDENGSISRMTAIEEQPSVTRNSRVESTRKSTRSHRGPKPTPSHSPAPPSLDAAATSSGHDRVAVLPRVRMSASHPQSVAPVGSPQASMLDTETESVLHSEGSEDFPPHNVARPDGAAPPSRQLSSTMVGASPMGRAQRTARFSKCSSRADQDDAFSEKPLYTMRETSLHSVSLNASMVSHGGAAHGEFDRMPLVNHRQAQPVGCITTLPSAPASPIDVASPHSTGRAAASAAADEDDGAEGGEDDGEAANRSSKQHSRVSDERRRTTTATDTPSEASLSTSAAAGTTVAAANSRKHKKDTGSAAQRAQEKPNSSRHSGGGSGKRVADFSDIVAVPNISSNGSPNGSIAAMDTKKKNSAWVFLFKARGSSAAGEGSKKGKKYLSTPPLSDAASHTDGDGNQNPGIHILNNNLDTVSETSSFAASPANSAVQPLRRRNSQQESFSRTNVTATTTAAEAAAALNGDAATATMVAESVSDTGLDVRPMREGTTVYMPVSPPSPASVSGMNSNKESAFLMPYIVHDGESAAAAAAATSSTETGGTPLPPQSPLSGHGTPVASSAAAGEGRRSPGVSAPNTPSLRRPSNPSSVSDAHLQPLPRRLSESAVLPASIGAAELRSPGAVSLPDALPRLPDAPEPQDISAQRSHAFAVTPERAVITATSAAATTGTSPATAHRQTRRGSTSALSDSATPPPPPERSRTPIPQTRKRLSRHGDHASSTPLLGGGGGDAMEPPVPRASNLSNTSSQVFAALAPRRSTSLRGSHAGGETGTPLSPDKAAHTPMGPFPRRPSLLSRERVGATSGKSGQVTPDASKGARAAQRNLSLDLKETPSKAMTPAGSRSAFSEE